ncbi:MAG TPA: protein kinase [Polyangiaceae bacterium]|nr:protein kinase [Polyangiaceae bacterium]
MSRYAAGELISGKYRIVRLIGDGGMGVVYEARHEVLGSGVALKFLHADLAKRPGLTERFMQEARVSATIQSPHVTHVTDVDTAQDGSPYLVMELLSGQSLQSTLDRQGKLPQDQALDFALQILAGLEAAHAIGVVHRDMKPDNVLVTPSPGGPILKLIDFGIAKLRVSSEFSKGLTRAGVVMGTPEYMAPEQLMSAHTTDHRADIYALGVMLFEMLSGLRPADGDDAEQIIAAVDAGRVRKLAEVAPAVPSGLVALVERATLPDREQRFEGAAAMRLALAAFAGQLSHAGRLAATAEPLDPLPTPVSNALLSLPAPIVAPGVPKTVLPNGAPLSVSQLGAARTSLSEGEPPMSQMGRPPIAGTAIDAPAAYAPPYAQSYAPPVAPRRGRAGVLVVALALVVLGGGGAVGYAAYRAVDHERDRTPPLPAASGPLIIEPLPPDPAGGTGPAIGANTGGATSALPSPRPAGPTPKPPGAGGPGTAPGSGAAGPPTFQLPFPIPSQIQIPTALPSGLRLPPGFPTALPPGFPGLPQPTQGALPTAGAAATPSKEPGK